MQTNTTGNDPAVQEELEYQKDLWFLIENHLLACSGNFD